jgi:predicted 3-demethylubiquinone-9 3-methyltransferase (glyoxalase superfamily)
VAAIPTIHPCLWFATGIQEAVDYYVGVFPNSRITGGMDSSEPIPSPAGEPVVITFELCGAPMMAINGGGTDFPFSEAISLVLSCDGQDEIDHYWAELTSGGGQESMCGWLRDRHGLAWQVVPNDIPTLLGLGDPEATRRASAALMQMRKIDIAAIERARDSG